ncbi:MAG: ABC transporter ATP-binding protein [Marinobacter sp.]|jgi:lipopolysaccharide transport system ATP-binding protein|nr:ABC transporter ATP-binding protein [Marinobacter sp.]
MGTITVKNLGKAYKRYPSRWARLAEWVLPGQKVRHQLSWVLQNISFTVKPGEAVGIVGMNGAGKSTLLKILTGTTMPSIGAFSTEGRVAALLELGMGFHPDFSGRQNAYMSAQLLGHSAEEIEQLMPHIEAFAEIGDYIDQPVRMYSSGMQVRLAFAVATAKRPDILIIDEALSVGDTYFQHKSFERIREFRKQGTTLLLVSHDKSSIQSICDRAILLSAGTVALEGAPEAVMDYYNAILADRENYKVQQTMLADGRMQTVSGSGEATVSAVELLDENESRVEIVDVGQPVTLQITVTAHQPLPKLVLGFSIKDRLGQVIYGTNTHHTRQVLEDVAKGSRHIFRIHFAASLGQGTYSVQTALVSSETHLQDNYEWRDLTLLFEVVNRSKETFAGSAWLAPTIEVVT